MGRSACDVEGKGDYRREILQIRIDTVRFYYSFSGRLFYQFREFVDQSLRI